MKILIVDDDVLVRKYFQNIFTEMLDADDSYAENYDEAISSVFEVEPSLVFLDINIPGDKNGLGVLKSIKEIRSDINIVMISSDSSAGNVKEAISNGANGFIKKPFSKDKIIDLLSRFGSTS